MNRYVAFSTSLVLIMFSHVASSQEVTQPDSAQITEPEMSLQKFSETEANVLADGRNVRRVNAATVGLIRVEWPEGSTTAPHNHANELIMSVVEGRLKGISGDKEFIMEAGDVLIVPAWVEHSYEALEDTITLEAAGPG
jgi:quercetin dioxygenase-like cupin family protein